MERRAQEELEVVNSSRDGRGKKATEGEIYLRRY